MAYIYIYISEYVLTFLYLACFANQRLILCLSLHFLLPSCDINFLRVKKSFKIKRFLVIKGG